MKSIYEKTISQLQDVRAAVYPFHRLGITVNLQDGGIDYCWQKVAYIVEIVKEDTWGAGLPMQSAMALSLACTEEERNNHVEDDEIEAINKFFNVQITRELVSKFHSKYI